MLSASNDTPSCSTSIQRAGRADSLGALVVLVMAVLSCGVMPAQVDGHVGRGISLADVRRIIRAQEDAAIGVSGMGSGAWTAVQGGGAVRRGNSIVSFVRDGDPAGRSLLDYLLRVSPWQDHPGVFWRDVLVHGYDGTVDWMLHVSTQREDSDDPPTLLNSATATDRRGVIHGSERCSGWFATMPGFYAERMAYFSEVLDLDEAPFTCRTDAASGDVMLSVVSKSGDSFEEWRLRRDWSYCLSEYARRDKAGELMRSIVVGEAVRLHEAFWYPTKIVEIHPKVGALRDLRGEFEIGEVRLRDDLVDEVFVARFPHNTHVTDPTTGRSVRIAAPDGELSSTILGQADELRRLVRYQSPSSWSWSARTAAFGVTLGLILLLVGHLRRRSQCSNGASGFLLAALAVMGYPDAIVAQDGNVPWWIHHLQSNGNNCALNAAALVAATFGRPIDLEVTATELCCGDSRLEAVSLDRVRAALGEMSLEAQGFRGARFADVVAKCHDERAVAIVHVATGRISGHYYVLAPAVDGVVLADPGSWVAKEALDSQRVKGIAASFTGNGLLVTESRTAAEVWNVDDLPKWSLSLGAVGRLATKSIRIVHGRVDSMELQGAESSCGCVDGVEMHPARLGRGEPGELRLRVDGTKLGTSISHQQILLRFAHAGGSFERRLLIDGFRPEVAPSAKPGVIPSLAVGQSAGEDRWFAMVSVVVPNGGLVAGWRGSEGVRVASSVIEGIEGGVKCRYRVDWSGSRALVSFEVQDGEGRTEVVHCALRRPRTGAPTTTGSTGATSEPTKR